MNIGQLVSMVITVLSRWMIELGASSSETLSFPFLLEDWSLPLGTAQTKISEESSGSLHESCSLAGQGGLYACTRVGTTDRLVL